MISRLEKDGVSGIEIVCEMFKQIHGNVDDIHIMALGLGMAPTASSNLHGL